MKKKLRGNLILSILSLLFIILLISCGKNGNINTDDETESISIEECTHDFSEWESISVPTCTQDGKNARICSKCKLVDVEYLPKAPHNAKVSQTVAPTCTAEGYSIYLCDCGYTYKADFTVPTGHILQRAETVAKSCSEPGFTRYKCDRCEYSFDSDFIPQSHDFEISITNPTATQSGFMTHTCKDCSYHYDNNFIKYKDILPSPYLESSVPLCKGLDIYDGDHETLNGEYLPLDWESIKAQGYDFVILKVGSDYSGKSKTFDMDYEGAKAAGLGVGAYYYAYSSTVSGTRNDAQEVLEWIKGKQFEYPIYYDIEENYLAENLSQDSLTEIITVFIEELQVNGYYSALYIDNNWLRNILDTQTVLDRFDIWYARYPQTENPEWNETKYGKQLSMWQFTDEGTVNGINNPVDVNYCYRDYPSLMKKWGLNGFKKEI